MVLELRGVKMYAKSSEIVSDCCGQEIEYEGGLRICSECGEVCQAVTEDEYYDKKEDE
jgi:hypothetical protein